MSDIELFLNDDFVSFSAQMSDIHTKLKEKNDHMKKVLEQYKEEKTALENQAKQLLTSWEGKKKEAVKK